MHVTRLVKRQQPQRGGTAWTAKAVQVQLQLQLQCSTSIPFHMPPDRRTDKGRRPLASQWFVTTSRHLITRLSRRACTRTAVTILLQIVQSAMRCVVMHQLMTSLSVYNVCGFSVRPRLTAPWSFLLSDWIGSVSNASSEVRLVRTSPADLLSRICSVRRCSMLKENARRSEWHDVYSLQVAPECRHQERGG